MNRNDLPDSIQEQLRRLDITSRLQLESVISLAQDLLARSHGGESTSWGCEISDPTSLNPILQSYGYSRLVATEILPVVVRLIDTLSTHEAIVSNGLSMLLHQRETVECSCKACGGHKHEE